jgi:hypothetical protein
MLAQLSTDLHFARGGEVLVGSLDVNQPPLMN